MLWSYDRREGDLAVLVNDEGESRTVSVAALPAEAREGRMLRQEGDTYLLDEATTEARRQQVLSLQERLLRRRKGST